MPAEGLARLIMPDGLANSMDVVLFNLVLGCDVFICMSAAMALPLESTH